MRVKLKITPNSSRVERLAKISNLYAATKFPDRKPRVRDPEEAEILRSWEERRNGFKIGKI